MDDTPNVRESYVPVSGARLFVRTVGTGPPLVVLHGGPDFNHNYLLPELDRLSDAFHLIYYDQRGRGKSSPGVALEDVGIESEIEDLDEIRRHFGFHTMGLLGHSWGALLAIEYATRHPRRVSHLILLNPAPASDADLARFREWRRATEPDRLARMEAISGSPEYARGDIATEAEYYRAHFGGTLRQPDQLAHVLSRLRSDFTPESIVKARAIEERLYAQTWRSLGYDPLGRLRGLKIPALVIHGDRDLIPIECAKRIAEALPGSRLLMLSDCGHFSYLERPAEVREAILEFGSAG